MPTARKVAHGAPATSPRRLRLALAVLCLAALACVPNIVRDPNENSGNDGERGKARLLELGTPENDRVDFTEGDATDWRYVQSPGAGELQVTLGCDYVDAYCLVNVRDEVGRLVRAIETSGAPRVSQTVPVERGNYYLEVTVPASATDYTIQADYVPN